MSGPGRAMVVGGAGFIGSHLAERLLGEGWAVDVVDDLSTGSLAHLAAARATNGPLTIHHLDATGPQFGQLVERRHPDVIVNLAAFTGSDTASLQHSFTLVTSTIEAARTGGVAKVVLTVPAVELYGPAVAKEVPLKEARGFQPDDAVGVTAVAALNLLEVARTRDSLEFTVLALADVYGPRQRPEHDPVAAACQGRPLERTLDLVHVDDVAEALLKATVRGGGLLVNIGSGEPVTAAELARIAGHDPVAVALRPRRFALSPIRARIHLSWAPWTPLAEGVLSGTDPRRPDGPTR